MNTTQDIALNLIDIPAAFRDHSMESVDALAQDIQRNGQLQEIVVTPKEDGRYELVAGKRRTLALRHLNWENVRAQVRENLSELQKALIMIAENDERADVNPFDRALSYQRAINAGADRQNLASKLGISVDMVNRVLSILQMSPEITEKTRRLGFSGAHLQELIRLPDAGMQLKLIDACDKQGWSSKVLRDKVSRVLAGDSKAHAAIVEEKPIRFSWKDGKLVIKAVFDPQAKGFSEFSCDFDLAYRQFVDLHPAPQAEAGVKMEQAA